MRKQNEIWKNYISMIEKKQEEKSNKKTKDAHKETSPPKMNRDTKRRYIKHYTRMGVPREEIERIIMTQQFSNMEGSKGVSMDEISYKVSNGQLPKNTLDILKEYQK